MYSLSIKREVFPKSPEMWRRASVPIRFAKTIAMAALARDGRASLDARD